MSEGFGVYGAGLASQGSKLSLGIGSSFAAPNVTGIAALLWEHFDKTSNTLSPVVSATKIRNAIVGNGNKMIIVGGETEDDQGNGWVDAKKARDNLGGASVFPPTAPPTETLVNDYIKRTLAVVGSTTHLLNLEPGDRQDVIYNVNPADAELNIELSSILEVACAPDPEPFFGNELQLAIHTVKTSTVGPTGQYYDLNPTEGFEQAFIGLDDFENPSGVFPGRCTDSDGPGPLPGICSFSLLTPEPGLLRISVSGATTNACNMSTDVTIVSTMGDTFSADPLDYGTVADGGTVTVGSIDVPQGAQKIEFELSWINDWTHYKGNDLELQVFLPGLSVPLPFGLTLDAPERFEVTSAALTALFGGPKTVPLDGIWTIKVQGFEVNEMPGDWTLRVLVDGDEPDLIPPTP